MLYIFAYVLYYKISIHVIFVVKTSEKKQTKFGDPSSMGGFFRKAQNDNVQALNHVGIHGASLL